MILCTGGDGECATQSLKGQQCCVGKTVPTVSLQARVQKCEPSHLASTVRTQQKPLLMRGSAAARGHPSGPHSSAGR